MATYLVKRLLLALPVLWGVGTFVFFLLRILPGDALTTLLQESNTNADLAELRAELGLDRSLPEQYLDWIGQTATLNFGDSLVTNLPVRSQLADSIPISAEMALIGTAVTVLVAVPGGIIAAARQDSLWDHGTRIVSVLFLALPNFWLATLALVLPAYYFGWVPPLKYVPIWEDPVTNLKQFAIPGVILGLSSASVGLRLMRSQMLEVLRQDYVRTGRAKGLAGRVVLIRHAAPNALIPVLALLGNEFARILGGTVILETIFGLPGVGRLIF